MNVKGIIKNILPSKTPFLKLNWFLYITIGVVVWFFIWPGPRSIGFTALLCIPIVGIILNSLKSKPNITQLITTTGRDKYDVISFIKLPAWSFLAMLLIDYQFENLYGDLHKIILPGTIFFISILILLFLTHKRIEATKKSKFLAYFGVIVTIAIYSYSSILQANCVYDNTEAKIYNTNIVDKNKNCVRLNLCFRTIRIENWTDNSWKNSNRLIVSKTDYERMQIGEKIAIERRDGLLNIPRYYIKK